LHIAGSEYIKGLNDELHVCDQKKHEHIDNGTYRSISELEHEMELRKKLLDTKYDLKLLAQKYGPERMSTITAYASIPH
jgi:hypothetical protein